MKTVRVLIVDDLPAVRQGLKALLELASAGIEVAGEAENGSEAVRMAQALHPDVVLMDLEMPVLDGYTATRQIKATQSACRVIILSIHASPEEIESARQAGADGYVVKGASYRSMLQAIQNLDGVNQPFFVRNGG